MSEEFYLKTKYTNRYLPASVPWSKRASRRRKFTYKDLENTSDKALEVLNIIELDEEYEAKMDKKEYEWFKKSEQEPLAEETSLFEEYSDIDDTDLDKALSRLEGVE